MMTSALAGTRWLPALRRFLGGMLMGNLIWETAHLPLYELWRTADLGQKAFAVMHCTGGDLLIGLSALNLALVLRGDRSWPDAGFAPVATLTVILGVAYTAFSEWLNIVVRAAWSYSDLMPVIPLLGFKLGLSPVAQWIVVPLFALLWARRVDRLTR